MFFPTNNTFNRILSIDITSRGFGYAILESPINLVDWGVKQSKYDKHNRIISIIERLLEIYKPDVLVVQNSRVKQSRRTPRMHKLIEDIEALGIKNKIMIMKISWLDVKKYFQETIYNAATKQEIAEAIVSDIPELVPRLPPKRKPWMSEDYRMSIFDAVAFGLTYYYMYESFRKTDITH